MAAAAAADWTFTSVVQKGTKSACRFVELPPTCDIDALGYAASTSIPAAVTFELNGVRVKTTGPIYYHGAGKPRILLLRAAVREQLGGAEAGCSVTTRLSVAKRKGRAKSRAKARVDNPAAREKAKAHQRKRKASA